MRWPWQKKVEGATVPKPKEFVFKTRTKPMVGDWYEYTVKADSKEEAFKKLVQYFYSDYNPEEKIESRSGQVIYQGQEIFAEGMPQWFALYLSGSNDKESRRKFEDYCEENNIVLSR